MWWGKPWGLTYPAHSRPTDSSLYFSSSDEHCSETQVRCMESWALKEEPYFHVSGQADVGTISWGMVVGGLWQTRWFGRSAYNLSSFDRAGIIPWTSLWSTLSWRQVNLPWFKEVGQVLRMWSTVGLAEPQRLHLELTRDLQHLRSRGVGRVSEAARRMKDSWPGGKSPNVRFHTLFSFSREQASLNFLWTVSLSRLESHFFFLASTWIERADLCKVCLLIDAIELQSGYLSGSRILFL